MILIILNSFCKFFKQCSPTFLLICEWSFSLSFWKKSSESAQLISQGLTSRPDPWCRSPLNIIHYLILASERQLLKLQSKNSGFDPSQKILNYTGVSLVRPSSQLLMTPQGHSQRPAIYINFSDDYKTYPESPYFFLVPHHFKACQENNIPNTRRQRQNQ